MAAEKEHVYMFTSVNHMRRRAKRHDTFIFLVSGPAVSPAATGGRSKHRAGRSLIQRAGPTAEDRESSGKSAHHKPDGHAQANRLAEASG